MANRIYGEAVATLSDGSDLTFRFDFGALVSVETVLDKRADEVFAEIGRGGIRLATSQALVYAGLRFHHREVTLEEVGDLILSDGEEVTGATMKALESFSAAREGKKPENPSQTKATAKPRGTGSRSSKSGQAPA
jgi:hypothetical protein